MEKIEFKGKIQAIQWNNLIKSNLMMIWFLFAIGFFVFLLLSTFGLIALVVDPKNWNDTLELFTGWRAARIFIKVLGFVVATSLYFMYRDFKNAGHIFSADKIDLGHKHPFYRKIEILCISRGLKVPELYMIRSFMPAHMVTGIVLQDLSNNSKLLLSQGVLNLPEALQEAFAAQAIQRIHTHDALFFTLLSFCGFFTFHMSQKMGRARNFIFRPFLFLTDLVMAPVRNAILNIRSARMDAGSLTLTKEKGAMHELLQRLSSLNEIEKYYHKAWLPLFIAISDGPYRLRTLETA